ncbi:hypothetical protein C8F04DRAFT_1258253 [Mycena alexandri]|uniref:Secreted protein n=1 Tax=Mycena alexandri TaxID=1745969 RepID=A0AAD6X5D2_9AGAR|nr:hypothetical protein C8F04DRAFT_1258253 [Mycena alexandri]
MSLSIFGPCAGSLVAAVVVASCVAEELGAADARAVDAPTLSCANAGAVARMANVSARIRLLVVRILGPIGSY